MSMFTPVRMLVATQPTATVMPVLYASIPAGQANTDPLFYYDPTTTTLNVPTFSITDLVIADDIEFTNANDHSIFVDPSAAATAGRPLAILSGDGGDASGAAAGGIGGAASLTAGTGGDGSAGQLAGAGGSVSIAAGDAGADGGAGGAAGGDVTVNAGNASGAAVDGTISIGTANTSAITLGLAASTFTINNNTISLTNDANKAISVNQSTPAGTAGRNLSITAGQGAAGSGATPGATSGTLALAAAAGGAGPAGAAAGVGGNVTILAGDGGTDGGGGGANGGDVTIDAGNATGAGNDGVVTVGGTNARITQIGNTTGTLQLLTSGQAVFTGGIDFGPEGTNRILEGLPASTIGLAGNQLTFRGGAAGAGNAGTPGGTGGLTLIQGGAGGAGSAAQVAGVGGGVSVLAANAGADGGGGGNDGGSIIVDAGAATGAGNNGQMLLGTTNARLVTIGRSGIINTSAGILALSQGLRGNDLTRVFGDSGYVALGTDLILIWDTSGGNCVQNLPPIANVRGQIFYVRKNTADANTLTIDPDAGETIDGAATLVLPGGARATAQIYAPDAGTDWIVL